MYKTIRSV